MLSKAPCQLKPNSYKQTTIYFHKILLPKYYLNYIGDIVNTIRDYVPPRSELAFFTIENLIHRVSILVENKLKESRCSINYILDVPGSYQLHGEINYLIQVLINLIDNAIDAYEGKAGVVEFRITTKDDNIIFSIKDFGVGISEDVSKRLFSEMITTKGRNGSGLGLYISKIHIRSKFKGNIELKSGNEYGTEFIIKIPIMRSNSLMKKIKIAIVDDDSMFLDVMKEKLSHYEVTCFSKSKDSMKGIKGNRFDIAILDFIIDEMNGQQLVQEIRR